MSKRILPKVPSPEAEKLARKYDMSDHDEKAKLAKDLGASRATLQSWRSNCNLDYPRILKETIDETEVDLDKIVLPEVKIREYEPIVSTTHEEEQGLIVCDGHAGKITKSYNPEVYKERMANLFQKAILIKNLHSHMYPLNKLHLLCLGDNVQGENPFQGSKLGEISMGARDQVVKLATPALLDLIFSLKQHYSEITLECFAGNHGKISKEAPATSNWDFLLYDILKSTLGSQKGIKVNIYEDFGAVVPILNTKFFCTHGDGTTTNGGVPWMAMARKVKSWHMQYSSGFEYVAVGHFHTTSYTEVGKDVALFMNGTLVSDDDWALNKMGVSSTPAQWTFGVSPHRGVTWQYPLNVTEKHE
jgi:hypothetical protein